MRIWKKLQNGFKTPVDWNLDYEFIVWLNKWLKVYKKNAGKAIDLEHHKFRYRGAKMTQLEAINRLIYLTEEVKNDFFSFEIDCKAYVDEIFELFHGIYWTLWW